MKFIDEATVLVIAGNGGRGCAGFRREKYIPFGGPNGGDGGDGGSVFLQASSGLNTLIDFRYIRCVEAKNGGPGRTQEMTGAKGDDVWVKVPVGTLVYDAETNEKLADLTTHGQVIEIAKGGRAGLGNVHFKTSTNRAPRKYTLGTEGERRQLRLELSVLANVGLIGLPNAGKSTLIRNVSNAQPKVADYPFTTLRPVLGVVTTAEQPPFVWADIPGIIEGASQGLGLGLKFLKHVMRTQLLLHVVEVAPMESDVLTNLEVLETELQSYDPQLMEKPRWIVLSKTDCLPEEELAECVEMVQARYPDARIFPICALQRKGTEELTIEVARFLETYQAPTAEAAVEAPVMPDNAFWIDED